MSLSPKGSLTRKTLKTPAIGGQFMYVIVRSVLGFVSCSCFHVFYFEVLLWFLFVSCFPFPHVFMLLVPLFNVSCAHWLS